MSDPTVNKPGELSGHPVELDAASATRRLALNGTRLAVPVNPSKVEGLAEILLRAAQRNGEHSLVTMWSVLEGKISKRNFHPHSLIDCYVSDETIANFLGTPRGAEDVAHMRFKRICEGFISFFGTPLRSLYLAQHRRVSPRSLSEFGYQKAIWSVLPLGFDPSNHETLLDRCPVCGVKLSFNRTHGICFCHECADEHDRPFVDLRDWKQPLIQLDSYENVDLACSLIDPTLNASDDRLLSFHPDLRSLERGQVFEFILLIARLLQKARGESLEGPVGPQDLDEATVAVRNWPAGVIDIGERVSHVWRQTYTAGREFSHPIFREVSCNRDLFGPDFVGLVRNQLRANKEASADPIHDRNLRSRIGPRAKPSKIGGFDTQKPGERFALAALLARNSAAIRKESSLIGLPTTELVLLYNAGITKCPDASLAKLVGSASNDDGVFETLKSRSTTLRGESWPLYETVTTLSRGKLIWPKIVASILRGCLAFSLEPGEAPVLARMRVSDIEFIQSVAAEPEEGSMAEGTVVPYSEVGFYLGFGIVPANVRSAVVQLVAGGLLPPKSIGFSDIRSFRHRFVTGKECLHRFYLNSHRVKSSWMIFGALNAAGIKSAHHNLAVRERTQFEGYLKELGYK